MINFEHRIQLKMPRKVVSSFTETKVPENGARLALKQSIEFEKCIYQKSKVIAIPGTLKKGRIDSFSETEPKLYFCE